MTKVAVTGRAADEIRTYFMQLAFEKGLLILSSHNITTAFSDAAVTRAAAIYAEIFSEISRSISNNTLQIQLRVLPLMPLFRVR